MKNYDRLAWILIIIGFLIGGIITLCYFPEYRIGHPIHTEATNSFAAILNSLVTPFLTIGSILFVAQSIQLQIAENEKNRVDMDLVKKENEFIRLTEILYKQLERFDSYIVNYPENNLDALETFNKIVSEQNRNTKISKLKSSNESITLLQKLVRSILAFQEVIKEAPLDDSKIYKLRFLFRVNIDKQWRDIFISIKDILNLSNNEEKLTDSEIQIREELNAVHDFLYSKKDKWHLINTD